MFPAPASHAAPRPPVSALAQTEAQDAAPVPPPSQPASDLNPKRDRSPSPPASPGAKKMERELRGEIDKKVKMSGEAGASATVAEAAAPPKTGLAHPEAIEEFVADMKAVQAGWAAKTPQEKIDHFKTVITAKFAAAGMPAPDITLMEPGGGRNGEFHSASWSLGMTADALARPMAETAGTAYHESRHAQQFFMIAKYIAKENLAPPPHQQIPARILSQAAQAQASTPLTPAETHEAQAYHASVYGADRIKRNHTLTKLGVHTMESVGINNTAFLKAKADYETAEQTFKVHKEKKELELPTFATDKALRAADATHVLNHSNKTEAAARFRSAHAAFLEESAACTATLAAYRALPEEADAFAVGDAVTAKLKGSASA